MRIYDELTESPETLGTFLKSLPVLDAPWDTAFQKTFCGECKEESCDKCPNGKYRNNPEWWLKLQEGDKTEEKATEFYYKLHKCLKKAMSDKELSCHANNIIRKLGKSIESGFTYYDQNFDLWCDYFLAHKDKQS